MKTNSYLTVLAAGLVVLIVSGNALACCGHCSSGNMHHQGTMWNNNGLGSEFNKETFSLREKAHSIELEIEKEYGKTSPDIDKITEFKKNLVAIHGKIEKIAIKHNLNTTHETWCWMDHNMYW